MFGKPKSVEFIAMQSRDISGANNPQFGVVKSATTIAKLTKLVHVYDASTMELIGSYATTAVFKQFSIGKDTLTKYILSGKPYKGKIFTRNLK